MSGRAREDDRGPDAEAAAERGAPVVFERDCLRILRDRRGGVVRYAEVTHIAVSPRVIAIGTLRDTIVLRRREFAGEAAMRAFERALRDRIARLPGGDARIARMAELDQLARRRGPRRAVYGFIAACVLVFAVQWQDPFSTHLGSFMPVLVADGELWRIVTANFLHDLVIFPIHLGLNLLCIAVVGLLVERVLGSWRTVVVMGFSAGGAMLGCALAGYTSTVGASGVAAGLVGALLCIELNGSRRLPVVWRIPRRIFFGALIAQAALDYFVPFIAGAAHLGGFLAGYAVTRLLVADSLLRRPVGPLARAAAGVALAGVVASAIAIAPLLVRHQAALERHALRLLQSAGGSAIDDNDVAWILVTETEPSEVGVQVAAALAERAVAETGRRDPNLLDTLAEVLFVAGDVAGAVMVIDEAIELSGGERYFVEQRRRFVGERDPDDRPEPPTAPLRERGRRDPPGDRPLNEEPAPDPGVII